ncbi:MAG TPA: hypothetical protein VKV20_03235 [Ktedonobacteraceae bacterium]|jgi:hypothetical protein|nr:hypothetical protein [Ktedonobacteraceae bacterium]
MSLSEPPSISNTAKEEEARRRVTKPTPHKRLLRVLIPVLLVSIIVAAWLLLNRQVNSTDPTVAGRPLSNPHTHLHTVALGVEPGVVYLGTHYGMFTSTDGGRTWPQPRGILNSLMITSIADSPANPNLLAVTAIPINGFGQSMGTYFSSDGGNSWQARNPPDLSASAYPYIIKAGPASGGQFYAFFIGAGLFETRDMGVHWYSITSNTLSNMQVPSLLADPSAPNHLFLGGDQGLYETHGDGHSWNRVSAVKGNVYSIVASGTTPRIIFCATNQGVYRWQEGSPQITQVAISPMASPPTRLAIDATGKTLYALSGQDLWYSAGGGNSWQHCWHFDRGDMVSLLVDPLHPDHLYAGFFLPAEVLYSTNGGKAWQVLTN